MEKITVETTSNIMLMDPLSGEEILPDRENTVPHTHFVGERIQLGQLRKVRPAAPAAPAAPASGKSPRAKRNG